MTSIGSFASVEELPDRQLGDRVGLVLEAVDLDAGLEDLARVLEVGEEGDRLLDGDGGLDDDRGDLLQLGRRRRDPVEDDPGGGGVDEVEDVVERPDEDVDVLAVDRRDPGPVQEVERLVGDLVALVLEALDLGGPLVVEDRPGGHRVEDAGGVEDDLGGPAELGKEGLFAGEQTYHAVSSGLRRLSGEK